MELFNGRPEFLEGRLPREVRVYDFLDALGIRYDRDKKFKTKELSNQINSSRLSLLWGLE